MQNFQLIAENVDVLPILHYAKVSGGEGQKVRGDREPHGPWFECPQLRGIVLDVNRRLDGVEIGEVHLLRIAAGEEHQILLGADPSAAGSQYYMAVVGGQPGATAELGKEVVPVLSGSIWWMKLFPKIVNNSPDDVWLLTFVLRLDV
jgi:hypothetical protein